MVAGCHPPSDSAWQLLQLALEEPWPAPGGPFFSFPAQMGIENAAFTL